jgi:hypothetical protein
MSEKDEHDWSNSNGRCNTVRSPYFASPIASYNQFFGCELFCSDSGPAKAQTTDDRCQLLLMKFHRMRLVVR